MFKLGKYLLLESCATNPTTFLQRPTILKVEGLSEGPALCLIGHLFVGEFLPLCLPDKVVKDCPRVLARVVAVRVAKRQRREVNFENGLRRKRKGKSQNLKS